jgi:S-adenosylmethionine hydrolase
MRIVTLTTDLGYRDPYLAIVKARLLTSGFAPQVIDLSCGIMHNHISDAAYVVKNALPYFPADTIHLVGIKFLLDKSANSKAAQVDNSRYLLTKFQDQYIISPDNGLFSLIDPAFAGQVYQLYYNGENKHHFYLKDIMAEVAVQILGGKPLEEFSTPVSDYYKAFRFDSYMNGNVLRGKAIYVDDFGNIVTNITRAQFEESAGKRKFEVTLPGKRISKISASYDDAKYGEALLLFNQFGYLEVAMNGKSAFKMLSPKEMGAFDFTLMIEFHE